MQYFYVKAILVQESSQKDTFTFLKQLECDHFERRIFLLLSILRFSITVTNVVVAFFFLMKN